MPLPNKLLNTWPALDNVLDTEVKKPFMPPDDLLLLEFPELAVFVLVIRLEPLVDEDIEDGEDDDDEEDKPPKKKSHN